MNLTVSSLFLTQPINFRVTAHKLFIAWTMYVYYNIVQYKNIYVGITIHNIAHLEIADVYKGGYFALAVTLKLRYKSFSIVESRRAQTHR